MSPYLTVAGPRQSTPLAARRPMFTELAMIQEADENGEPRVLALEPARVLGRTLERGLALVTRARDARRRAFRQAPKCCHCHSRIRRVEHCALVTLEPPRVAHRHGCYARAVMQHDPVLAATLVRVGRAVAEEVAC